MKSSREARTAPLRSTPAPTTAGQLDSCTRRAARRGLRVHRRARGVERGLPRVAGATNHRPRRAALATHRRARRYPPAGAPMPRLAIFSAILATFSLAAASNGCNKGDGDAYENYRAATPTGGNKCAPTPVPVCEDLRADATLTASALYPTARVGSKHGGAKACTKAGDAAVTTESNGDLCVGAPPSSPSPPPPYPPSSPPSPLWSTPRPIAPPRRRRVRRALCVPLRRVRLQGPDGGQLRPARDGGGARHVPDRRVQRHRRDGRVVQPERKPASFGPRVRAAAADTPAAARRRPSTTGRACTIRLAAWCAHA